MATVRPISPQYQQTLDSAISLARELNSRNMTDSGEPSPKTPNSPDKKRFTFKLKHFTKSFSEASANIRDIESSISLEAKQAYKTLVERGPYNTSRGQHSPLQQQQFHTISHHHNHHHSYSHHNQHHHHHHPHHHHSQHAHHGQYVNEDFTFPASKIKQSVHSASTFSLKKSFF